MHLVRSPRRRPVAWLAIALFACLPASPAWAAQAPEAMAPAPLRAALLTAWQHHPSYRATEAQLSAARARLAAAGQPLYNPELELSGDDEGSERTTNAGLNLTLDLSGKRRVRRDAASAHVDQATAEARVRRRDFARQWFTGWADLQTAQLRVRTGERRLALVTRFGELAEKQFAADDISGLERDLALLARDEAQAEQAQLLAEQADAEARFRVVGGTSEWVAGTALPTDTLPVPEPIDGGLESLPDWQAAHAAATAAEREVTVARRNRIAGTQVDVFDMPEALPTDPGPGIEARLMLQSVQEAMQDLPEEQREVLHLVCIEDMSYAETAEILAIPKGTVMSRLSRARLALAERLGIK